MYVYVCIDMFHYLYKRIMFNLSRVHRRIIRFGNFPAAHMFWFSVCIFKFLPPQSAVHSACRIRNGKVGGLRLFFYFVRKMLHFLRGTSACKTMGDL